MDGSFAYLLRSERGFTLVDTGWGGRRSFAALADALNAAGATPYDVSLIVLTHTHRDHCGHAAWFQQHSGARIGVNASELMYHARLRAQGDDAGAWESWFRDAGVTRLDRERLVSVSCARHSEMVDVDPDFVIEDGETVDLGPFDVTALLTPGHAPGHLCLFEPHRGILFSGDHVLPRITPNIGLDMLSSPDPLGDYLASLERVRSLNASVVLPGHEGPFVGLAERTDQTIAHHRRRIANILSVVGDGELTGWEVAQRMRWSYPWDAIGARGRRAALAEALAHLRFLVQRGALIMAGAAPSRYRHADVDHDPSPMLS